MAEYKYGGVGDLDIGFGTGVKVMTLPFVVNDGTVQETGWSLPAKSVVLYVVVEITTADVGETMDIGITGTSDALGDLVDIGTAGWVNEATKMPYFTEPGVKTVVYDCTGAPSTAIGNIHIVYANLNN